MRLQIAHGWNPTTRDKACFDPQFTTPSHFILTPKLKCHLSLIGGQKHVKTWPSFGGGGQTTDLYPIWTYQQYPLLSKAEERKMAEYQTESISASEQSEKRT